MPTHLAPATATLVLAAILAAPPTPAAAEVALFGPDARIHYETQATLSPVQQAGMQAFTADKQYFGVFVIIPDTDFYFFLRGFHSWSRAISSTLMMCQMTGRAAGLGTPNCLILASAIPASLDMEAVKANAAAPLPEGLGQRSYLTYTGDYQTDQVPGAYGAFAISSFAQDAYSFGFPSEQAASDRAIAQCEAFVAQAIVPFPREIRDMIRQQGLDRCQVVDVRKP